jgi:pimeloyl-ACP methyl ester carboxylesterase
MNACWLMMRITAQVFPVIVSLAHASDRPRLSRFDVNGVKVAYFVQREGAPVVLIHGWLSSAGVNLLLPGNSALLSRDHQLIALDVHGHRLSDKPVNKHAYVVASVEDILRLIDHFLIAKDHIVGCSIGGVIAGNFITWQSDRVLFGTLGGIGWLKVGSAAQFGFEQIGHNDHAATAHAVGAAASPDWPWRRRISPPSVFRCWS